MMPPNRRQEWLVRLLLYPAAIALIALWWHQHQAAADDGGGGKVVQLVGRTSQGEVMTGELRDGRPDRFTVRVRYHCPSGGTQPDYVHGDVHGLREPDRIDGDRVRTRVDGYVMTGLRPGWGGTYTFHTDGRFTATSWRGTVTAADAYIYRDPRDGRTSALTCRSGAVRFVLRRR
jgi:hypothetical protein